MTGKKVKEKFTVKVNSLEYSIIVQPSPKAQQNFLHRRYPRPDAPNNQPVNAESRYQQQAVPMMRKLKSFEIIALICYYVSWTVGGITSNTSPLHIINIFMMRIAYILNETIS